MKSLPPRAPTILDAMIFVAATAAGFALIRATGMDFRVPPLAARGTSYPSSSITPGVRYSILVQHGLSASLPFLTTWTPALLVVRLRQPRPRLRSLARQPGMIACGAVTLALAFEAVWIISLLAVGARFAHPKILFVSYAPKVGISVMGAWLALGLGGWWRPEPSWGDRLGRALGFAWIAADVIAWGRYFLTAF